MGAKLIVLNGKTYGSIEEMPPDIRAKYELALSLLGHLGVDANRDGVPDAVEGLMAGGAAMNAMRMVIDGKKLDNIEALPPEVRARYEEAMRRLDANENGIPDFIEGILKATNQTANISTSLPVEEQPLVTASYTAPVSSTRAGPLSNESAITPDTSNGWMLALAVVFILLLCAAGAAAAWYFLLR